MTISGLFIRRPVATTLVMSGILLFGLMAYRLLPVSDLPNVDYPTITVSASVPGASPETMASAVAPPLANQVSTIAGRHAMDSSPSHRHPDVTLALDLARDLHQDQQELHRASTPSTGPFMPG